ncbi:MAG: hypothetical protein ACJ79T_13685 [Myxococcales bacterium]
MGASSERVAFKLPAAIDSSTVLDEPGAGNAFHVTADEVRAR